jgi:hypothetical protein
MIIICLYIVVKISKFWKWILSKLKQKDPSELEEDHVESQKHVEQETKLESSIANGGITEIFGKVKVKSLHTITLVLYMLIYRTKTTGIFEITVYSL